MFAAAKLYDTVTLKFIPLAKDKKKYQIKKQLRLSSQPYSQVHLVCWNSRKHFLEVNCTTKLRDADSDRGPGIPWL